MKYYNIVNLRLSLDSYPSNRSHQASSPLNQLEQKSTWLLLNSTESWGFINFLLIPQYQTNLYKAHTRHSQFCSSAALSQLSDTTSMNQYRRPGAPHIRAPPLAHDYVYCEYLVQVIPALPKRLTLCTRH